jgi:4-hydroxy-tetrahydrodipicolinate reductase
MRRSLAALLFVTDISAVKRFQLRDAFDIMSIFMVQTMKIALIGYGRMGREVEMAAAEKGHAVVARIDPFAAETTEREISAATLESADVCIEFTQPDAVVKNVRQVAHLKKPVVIGTTGWYEQLATVEKTVLAAGAALVYAPNFSLGVNLFYRIAETAAALFNRFEEYDVCCLEMHHRKKVDSPSGTAKKLAEIILKSFPRKKQVVTDALSRPIGPEELHVGCVRAGHFPGVHSIQFDSAADTVELVHTVRSRAGFAAGALLAAEWIVGRQGVYTFEQVLEDFLRRVGEVQDAGRA